MLIPKSLSYLKKYFEEVLLEFEEDKSLSKNPLKMIEYNSIKRSHSELLSFLDKKGYEEFPNSKSA